MKKNTRLLLVVGIAVVTAGLASLGMYVAIGSQPAVTVEVPSAYVIVAAKPIEMGVSLTAEHLRQVAWPARDPVQGAFSKIEDVVNRGLIAAVVANEPITESKLAPREAGGGLSLGIRQGMRAMSVKVNEVIGVAGFVVPGTKVDVLVTIPRDGESVSRVVVSNVQVLTAGTRFDEMEAQKAGKPIPTTVVTLMVSPLDAERITLASTEGQIMLALRNPMDTEITQTTGVRTAMLVDGVLSTPAPPAASNRVASRQQSALPVPPPEPPAPPAVRTFETIKAGKKERETVVLDADTGVRSLSSTGVPESSGQ